MPITPGRPIEPLRAEPAHDRIEVVSRGGEPAGWTRVSALGGPFLIREHRGNGEAMHSDRLNAFWSYWLDRFGDDPSRWFYEGWRHDDEIEGFRPLFEDAAAGRIRASSPAEHALIAIVLDQLPRHLFRGRAEAYAWDARAMTLARAIHDAGWHLELDTWTFIFWTTVFEHAEDLDDHVFARRLFVERLDGLADGDPDRPHLEKALSYLDKHSAVLEAFGRYPKRVEVRGQPLTDAERRYLDTRVGKPY